MEKLKIVLNGKEVKIFFNERYSKGIFIVNENDDVKKNCKILNIVLQGTFEDNELRQMVTKLDKCSLVTMNAVNEWVQYIILEYTDKKDFESLLSDAPKRLHEVLLKAYNLNKMSTLNDFEMLGGAIDNQN
jgi:hypothetical protein